MSRKPKQTKTCPACGLPFENRRKWESRNLWPSIVYCSERCRRRGRNPNDSTDRSSGD